MEEYNNSKSRRKNKFDKTKKYIKNNPHARVKKNKVKDPERTNKIEIWNNTKNYFSGMKVEPSTVYYIYEINFEINNNKYDTLIEVKNIDTFDMALEYKKEGLNPLVLNMASDFKPGGGVGSGSSAQEECLFRRSNAHLTHPEEWYPLETDEVIYSPEVYIVKKSDYELLNRSEQSSVGMVAVPALRKPKLIKGTYRESDIDIMTNKIESIFKIGILKNHDSLVLGALGCGAFKNPPGEVASIFQNMINKYKGYYKKIGFAILVVKDTDKNNLNTFKDYCK